MLLPQLRSRQPKRRKIKRHEGKIVLAASFLNDHLGHLLISQNSEIPTAPEAIEFTREELKETRKARKKGNKAAQQAAKALSDQSNPNLKDTGHTSGAPVIPDGPQNKKNKKQKKKAKWTEEREPLAQDASTIDPSASGYSFRHRDAGSSLANPQEHVQGNQFTCVNHQIPAPGTSGGHTSPAMSAALLLAGQQKSAKARSPSPATSVASENSLLDRLEEGLGFSRQ
jgi:hypothetical protein